MNIGFIGLGKLGLPCAEIFAEQHRVYGYDSSPRESLSITICQNIEEVVLNAGLIFVAVPTPHDPAYGGEKPSSHLPKKNFDYGPLEEVVKEISKHIAPEKIVVIISTVLPGTMRKLMQSLPAGIPLLYNPYLIAMGTVAEDFKNPEMIIIGAEESSGEAVKTLMSLYHDLIGSCRVQTGTWEEAESIKIFYNTFISFKIAFVNMIQDVSERLGNINVDVVTDAIANSTQRITGPSYFKAGMGDGGPCHPRDNIALSKLAEDLHLNYDLFHAISVSREEQARQIAEKLVSYKQPIVILGKNYKPGVELTDGSYALLVAHYLQELKAEVYYDTPDQNRKFTYLLSHENIYNNYQFTAGSTILDIWRSFKTSRSDLRVIPYGNTRKS